MGESAENQTTGMYDSQLDVYQFPYEFPTYAMLERLTVSWYLKQGS